MKGRTEYIENIGQVVHQGLGQVQSLEDGSIYRWLVGFGWIVWEIE